ncbi:uncharacterized protein LOC129411877 [Boleophthalmus pectinirostris]|uniref:uncharacterized protein LOC129411877 n=1 Tax=Boleophthalmus pectinirostris TaxID=150288 RepID=UPI002431D400|nr:uncharacterized protein LOC129411877 [Boleophthalmus pectinirostris]
MSAVCSLLLLSLLHISEGQQMLVVQSGDVVTLPCGNASLKACSNIKWTHNKNDIIVDNQTHSPISAPPTSTEFMSPYFDDYIDHIVSPRRLNLTETCGLQLGEMEEEDTGVYACTELNQTLPSSEFFLSMVTFLNYSSNSWGCKVKSHDEGDYCTFTVRLLVQGSDQNQNQSRFKFQTSTCSASLTFTPGPSSPSVSCEVTDLNHNQVYIFGASPEEPERNQAKDPLSVVIVLMLLIRSVELLMVFVTMVTLLRVHARCSSADNHQVYENI